MLDNLQKDNILETTDITTDFFQSIKNIKVLTREEEQKLFEKYRETGSLEIKQELILYNQKLVVSIANKYKNITFSLDLMDLVMEGNFGLATAIEKFDASLGTKFSTYATHWIKQSITRAIDNYDKTVRVPVHFNTLLRNYYNYVNEYKETHEKEPSEQEIINELKLTKEQLNEIRKVNIVNILSLNEQIGEDEDSEVINFVPDESVNMIKELEAESFKNTVDEIIDKLWLNHPNYERNKDIVYKRFGFLVDRTSTLSMLSNKYDISRERIRQIESKFLRECRKPKNRAKFQQFR